MGRFDADDTTTRHGNQAESCAARFLQKKGWLILARNFRCPGGEIDLICRDADTLVFVEVRLRRHSGYGGAGASITRSKQLRLVHAARYYLATQFKSEPPCRFDCVLLDQISEDHIEWIRDAFSAPEST